MTRSQKQAKQFFAIALFSKRTLKIPLYRTPNVTWSDAFTVLERGDHYISVMIRRAVGRKWRPWWKASVWRAIPAVLILLAVFVGLVFAVKAITGLGARRDEAAATIWMIAVTLAVVYSIARLAFGEAVDKFIDRILGFFESDREV